MDYPIVCLGRETKYRLSRRILYSHGAVPNPISRSRPPYLAAPFVERNMGIGIVVRFFGRKHSCGRTFEVRTKCSDSCAQYLHRFGNRGQISRAAQEFLEYIKIV